MCFFRTIAALLLLAASGLARQVTVTLLATTDLHGNVYPYDYYTAKPVERGLAKIATLIEAQRRENPNNLLIDCGDTIQGTPLETVYEEYVKYGHLPLNLTFPGQPFTADPMMLAMNHLHYDAMVVGNHEFNFGLKNFNRARSDAQFPWISATIVNTPGSTARPFAPYIVKTVAGVKVAIIGITTPFIPHWDPPEHYAGYTFREGVPAAADAVRAVREKEHPDIVIVAAHAGLNRDLKTGEIRTGNNAENMVYGIATKVPGIDAIVFGHTHQQLPEYRIGNVVLMQPKNWGGSLARFDFTLEGDAGAWSHKEVHGRILPVTSAVEPDPEILAIVRPYQEVTEKYLNTPVAESPVEMTGKFGRIADSPLVDAIQEVQRHYAMADLSFTSLFNPQIVVHKGPVTVREIAALYLYDNELYAVEGDGKMVREALENAARYFFTCPNPSCSEGPLINRRVIGYNFDMADGVTYDINLTKPEGQRIENLLYQGKPLEDTQTFRIALNNYRAGGSGGYTMFRRAKIVWRSSQEIRDLMVQYYTEKKLLPAQAGNNWRIVPAAAEEELRREVSQEF